MSTMLTVIPWRSGSLVAYAFGVGRETYLRAVPAQVPKILIK